MNKTPTKAKVETRPYHVDISDEEFSERIPVRLRSEPTPRGDVSDVALPPNAMRAKVARLTVAINKNNENEKYTAVRTLIGQTYYTPIGGQSVTDAEVWYHCSGKSHGKVVRVQVMTYQVEPYLLMTHAHVVRNEPEDRMLLMSAEIADEINGSGGRGQDSFGLWTRYCINA